MAIIKHIASGNRQGVPLMLIHPMGADSTFWDSCRSSWDPHYFSVACELRGAGRSPVLDFVPSFDSHAADIEALAEYLRLESFVVVGCAVGAMIATRYAATFRERVSALVLANPGFRTREAARAALANRAAEIRSRGLEAVASAVIEATFLGQPNDEAKARFAERFHRQDPEAYAMAIDAMLDADTRPDLDRIGCPILLVPGGMDKLLPPDHADDIRRMKPAAEMFLVAEAAHFVPYQKPELFAKYTDAFVRRVLEVV